MTVVEWISGESLRTRADGIVVNHLAQSIGTAHSRTRILALLVDTSLVLGTIRVFETFRLAIGWFAKVSRLTFTDWSGSQNGTYGVWTTGIGHTRAWDWIGFLGVTLTEWIAFETFDASTHSSMYCHSTIGIESTSTRTRISTFLIDTSLGGRTFSIQNTFGFAAHQRIANVVITHTFANGSAIQNGAQSVGSTR